MGFLSRRAAQKQEQERRARTLEEIETIQRSNDANRAAGKDVDAEDGDFVLKFFQGSLLAMEWTSAQEELVEGRLSMDLFKWSTYWAQRERADAGNAGATAKAEESWKRCLDYFGDQVLEARAAVERDLARGRQRLSTTGQHAVLTKEVKEMLTQLFGWSDVDKMIAYQWSQIDYFSGNPIPERQEWLLRLAAYDHGIASD